MPTIDLRLGDCQHMLAEIPDGSVQMVLCDLPYGTTRNKWDCPLDLVLLWREYRRICTGPVVLTAQTPFDKVLGASNLADLRYEWVWEKGNASGHLNAKRAPMKAHENVLVFYSRQPTYNPQMTDGHERKTSRRIRFSTNYGEQRETSYDSTRRYVLIERRQRDDGTWEKATKYVADFVYTDVATGKTVVEDVKSPATRKNPTYVLKRKLMLDRHGITIKEL